MAKSYINDLHGVRRISHTPASARSIPIGDAMDELPTDELTFLRGVEQDVQRIQTYARMNPEYDEQVTSLKRKLNERIIELLEEATDADQ